jgi:hypothetical protein
VRRSASIGRLADVEHEVQRRDGGADKKHDVVPGKSGHRCFRASREDQEGERQHAGDQEVEVLGVELREADEKAQRELLVDAEENRDAGQDDERPAPRPRQRPQAHGFGLGGAHLVRVVKDDRRRSVCHGMRLAIDY